jgi:hypothetical protein
MKQFLVIALLFASFAAVAQSNNTTISSTPEFTVEVTQAIYLGKTKPIRSFAIDPARRDAKMKEARKMKQKPANFKGRHGSNVILPEKEFNGPDPLRQMGGGNVVIEPIVNIDGIGDFGSPHDPTGEVGENHFLQAVNVTDVGVFSKEGDLIDEFAMQSLWQGLGVNSAGDPIILYDETVNRWLVTEFTFPANLLVAISETSDPLGSYDAYNFTTPQFPDYPKYSIWPDSYLVSTNENGGGTHVQYFIDRAAMLNGDANVTIQRVTVTGNNNSEGGFFVSTPVDWDGTMMPNTDPTVLSLDDSSWGAAANDGIRIITFDVDFANSANTSVSEIFVQTTPYDSYPCSVSGFGFQCVPQLGGGGLDAIPEVIMNIPKYRNFGDHESMVCCFVTDVTNGGNLSGIRWIEFQKSGADDWSVYQEGTYAPADGLDRYMGSIAIDEDGNIGLGFSVSSEDTHVGLRYTGRYESDPLGMMTVEEYHVVDGSTGIQSGGRYGDYAHMSVDPENGNTFWFTSEYARSGGSGVGTRIVAFELARDTFDLAVTHITAPVTSASLTANELLTIEVENVGLEPMSNFTLSFEFEGTLLEITPIAGPLLPQQTYTHTFTVPMDMSAFGPYTVTAFVSHPDDTAENNDQMTSEIIHLLNYDAGISSESNLSACGEETLIPINISNSGFETLTSGTLSIVVNGNPATTFPWNGSLAFNQNTTFDVPVTNLSVGTNTVTITFVNPNGQPDGATANNSVTVEVTASDAGGLVTFNLHTDDYPEETSWQLENAEGNIIATGGAYTNTDTDHFLELCLGEEECYTFTIFDSFGDGICCDFGSGFFEFTNAEGTVLANGGQFGDTQTVTFCNTDCLLGASYSITQDSGSGDGTIMITAENGVGPFQYSIDGGITFQSSSVFNNLSAGSYNLVITSGVDGCTYEETINLTVGISELNNGPKLLATPNPSDGYFQLELSGMPAGIHQLEFDIYDSRGALVQSRSMSRYGDVFTTRVSLLAFADGIYFIKVKSTEVSELLRIVKQAN